MNRTNKFDVLVLIMVVLTVLVAPTQMALSLKAGPAHTVSDIGLSLADALLALTALVWGIGVLARGQLRQLRWPPAAAWVFLLLCVPSLFWTGSAPRGAAKLAQYIEYFFVAYLVFINTMITRRARIAVLVALLAGLVVNTGLAYRTYYMIPVDKGFTLSNVAGLLKDRSLFGAYLCLLVPIAGALALFARQIWVKVLGAILVLASAGVMLAGGPFIGLIVGLGVLVAMWNFRALPVYLGLVLVAVLAAMPMMRHDNRQILAESLFMFNEQGKDEGHGVSRRYLEWQAALKSLDPMQPPYAARWDYPRKVVFGHGIGLYEKEIELCWGSLPRANEMNETVLESDTQNQYVVLAITTGFASVLAFVWLLACYAHRARLTLIDSAEPLDKAIAAGVICAVIAIAVAGNFGLFVVRGVGLVLVCLAALAAAQRSATDREVSHEK